MTFLAADIVNQALELTAQQVRVTSLTDGTPAAIAANVIYIPTVSLMLRVMEPDFSRTLAVLTDTGVPTPPDPWNYQYLYPADCLRVLQVRPARGTYDPNTPGVVRWMIETSIIATIPTKVVLTNQISASAIYVTNTVTEDMWDFAFMNAVVRRLANPLAMALAGRPDFAKELLEESSRAAAFADGADEAMIRSA